MKPRLLDLFCGAGGAAMGYHRAGFEVVGVDIKPQPNYPFEFFHRDVFEVLHDYQSVNMGFDAIHASPPCQAFIRGGLQGDKHEDLLTPTREWLESWKCDVPWVIENVPGAPMRPDVVLCGSMFGLPLRRHRWFEFSWGEPMLTLSCDHSRPIVGVYGRPHGKAGAYPGMLPGTADTWATAMGVEWMTAEELSQAIPPAYTEYIGAQLLQYIERVAA